MDSPFAPRSFEDKDQKVKVCNRNIEDHQEPGWQTSLQPSQLLKLLANFIRFVEHRMACAKAQISGLLSHGFPNQFDL
jgi:hypothetical protein